MGPSLLAHDANSFYTKLFPPAGTVVLKTLGYFGFIIHVFGLGVHMNANILRGIGRKAITMGLCGLVCSAVAAVMVYSTFILSPGAPKVDKFTEYGIPLFITINSVSSFLVIMCHLMDLDILNSEIGYMSASAAVVADISGWFVIAFMANVIVAGERYKKQKAFYAVLDIVFYYWFMFFVFRPLIYRIVRRTPDGKPLREGDFFIVIAIVLWLAFWAEYIGQHAAFGVFLFGLSLPDGPPLGNTFLQKFETIASSLLLPVFYAVNGLRTDIHSLNWQSSPLIELVIVMGYVGKFVGALVSALLLGVPFRDALPVALILCTKGIMEVSAYGLCKDSLVLTDEFFTLAIITMIVMNGIILPIVKRLYDPSTRYMSTKGRCILDADHRGVFRLLVCIHREENVPTMVRLLQSSYPSRDSPISVFVLQLSELVGFRKATIEPHRLQMKTAGLARTYSERVVNAFSIFEKHHQSDLKLQHFTAVAPYATMHNDICTVAHDKGVSIIILPFHKQWSVDGTVDDSLGNIRRLNRRVLKGAPCSVGVLIDRGLMEGNNSVLKGRDQSLRSIVVLYIGGSDDHEALVYARRMAEDPTVQLLVVWIKSQLEAERGGARDSVVDREVMKEFLGSVENRPNVTYRENFVEDGTGTTRIARAIEDHAELVMVGRHHSHDCAATLGLAEWSDCPELGAVGDMLATWDFRFSVLVIQQQPQSEEDPVSLRQSSLRSYESKRSSRSLGFEARPLKYYDPA